jgi:hypothetical protein
VVGLSHSFRDYGATSLTSPAFDTSKLSTLQAHGETDPVHLV